MLAQMKLSFDEVSALHNLLEKTPKIGTPDISMSLNSLYAKVRNKEYITVEAEEAKHPTEEKYPEQVNMFRKVIERMYQTHLEKNADYSPMNILSTGIVGICTRIWDKTARILNLMGWNLQTGELSSERKSTKDESIEDNLLDLAVYCIIALIYREGKWGK